MLRNVSQEMVIEPIWWLVSFIVRLSLIGEVGATVGEVGASV